MPHPIVPLVEMLRICRENLLHERRKIVLRSAGKQVEMVVHEAPCEDLNLGGALCLGNPLDQIRAVVIVLEDDLPSNASAHDMVDFRAAFDSRVVRHRGPKTRMMKTPIVSVI